MNSNLLASGAIKGTDSLLAGMACAYRWELPPAELPFLSACINVLLSSFRGEPKHWGCQGQLALALTLTRNPTGEPAHATWTREAD